MGLGWTTLINAASILAPFTAALILHSPASWPFLEQQALSVAHLFLQLLDLLLEDAFLTRPGFRFLAWCCVYLWLFSFEALVHLRAPEGAEM